MIRSLFDRFPLLSTRLSIYIFSAAAVPLLLFSLIVYRLYAKEHYANQLEHLEFVRDDRTQRISSWFEERWRDLTYFSGQIESSIRANGGKIDGSSPASIAFATFGRTHNDIEGVLLLNAKGDVILSSRNFRDLEGNDVTNIFGTQVFSEMITHGPAELYVSGWFKSSVDGVPRMYLSRCICHGSEVVAVLAIQVNINKWIEFFQNRKGLSAEEEVLVYSDDGQSQNPTGWDEKGKGLFNHGAGAVGIKSLKELFSGRAIEGIDHRGVSVVAVQAPVSLTDFTLAVKCDSAQFYGHVRWAFLWGSLSILLIMALSAIGARLLARKITRPFRTLSRTAVEISMGNLYARTRLNRDDEIGRLADAFDTAVEKVQNQMVELERLRSELKQERDELDRKVRERTEELRRANSISRAIADYTVDWELWLSPTGQLRWTNPACERVTGYSVDEMLCTPDFWRLISEGSTRRMFLTLFRAALDGMNGEKVEFRCRKKDGSLIWLRVSWQRIYDSDGTYIGMRASAHDVTFEVDQRLENQRLAEVVNQSSAAISIRDRDGNAIYVNGAFLRMFGVAPDGIIGKSRSDFFAKYTGEESAKTIEEIESCIGEGCRWEGTVTNRRASGDSFITQTFVFPVRSEDNSIVNYVESRVDITAEIENKNRLRQMASAVEQCVDGVIIRNLVSGNVVYVNDAFLRITGYTREYVLQSQAPGGGPNAITNCSPKCAEVVWSKETWREVCVETRPDGTTFKMDCIISPICDEAGNVVYGLGFFRDVTKEMKARAEVERLGIVLNQSVTAMMITDSSARVAFANDSFFALTGFNSDEVVGRNIRDIPFGFEFEKEFSDALETLKDGRPWMGYFNPPKTGGEKKTLNVFVSPVKDAAGRASSYLMNFWDVTEEIKNRTEVSRLAQVMEQSANAIVIKTLDMKILYVNRAYTEMTGLAKAEVIGKTAQEIGLDCISAETYAEIRRTVLAGETWTGRVHSCRKDGTSYILKMVASPVFDTQGEVMNLVVNKQDITQEVAAVQTAERLGEVLQQSSLAMLVSDADHKLTDVNEAFLQMHGGRREDMLGRSILDLPVPETMLDLARTAVPVLEKGEVFSGEYAIPDGSGGETVCETVVTTVFGKDGRALYHLAIFRDISHEVETRNRMLQLVQVIEQSPYVVEITDKDGRLTYVNAAFSAVSGCSPEEVLGRFVWDVRAAAIEQDAVGEVWKCIRSGTVWHGDLTCERKNGTQFVMRSVIAPIRNEKGDIVSFVATKMDISPMLELETQMRQAQKMESIGRLAGGIAHDFNNMLQGIMGFAELLDLDTEGNSALNVNVKEIQRAAGRARDLTRQLLAFGRKQQSRPQVLDLNTHILNMEKMLGRLLSVNTPLSIKLDEHLPQVMADPGQVEQAIMNLVLNARDAVAQVNYARISVTGRDCFVQPQECIGKPEMSPGHYVCVSVSDNGCGIPVELRSRIFEPFFTTKENEKGTGLGLSVAYGIMKQHQGWIGLDSVVGKGTTFNLYFPVAEGDIKNVVVSTVVPADEEDFKGHGQIILVVEDEDLVRDLAVQNLKRAGYEVLTAATAPHGLKIFMQNRNRVALLFSDVVLLDGTGVELADHIRKMVPDLPVLLTSGFSREHLDNRNLETDNYGFLPKPYAREDMLKAIFVALQTASRGNVQGAIPLKS